MRAEPIYLKPVCAFKLLGEEFLSSHSITKEASENWPDEPLGITLQRAVFNFLRPLKAGTPPQHDDFLPLFLASL